MVSALSDLSNSLKDLFEVEEVKDAMLSIAEIIYMELPLRYQDAWLEDIREKGMWKPEVEIEEGMKKECCRNGCHRCEQ